MASTSAVFSCSVPTVILNVSAQLGKLDLSLTTIPLVNKNNHSKWIQRFKDCYETEYKKVIEKGNVSYHVTTESGDPFLLSFTKDPELVFILNVNTSDFSTMSGRGLDFSNIIK